jgi:hypothetical protein
VTAEGFTNGEASRIEEAGPPALSPSVVAALGEAGLTVEQYAAAHFCGDGQWWGDRCGCPDDRCIGFHHFGEDDCGCFPVVLEMALDEQQARRWSQLQARCADLEAADAAEDAWLAEQEAAADEQRSNRAWQAGDDRSADAAAEAVEPGAELEAELGEAGL